MTIPIEPITVEFLKSYCRLITTGEDELLEMFITAAREKAETYCNRYFASQQATRTYPIDRPCPVPTEDIISVSGFYTNVAEATNAYTYFVEYLKGSIVNRDCAISTVTLPTYTVQFNVTVQPEDVPASVKVAIAKIAADLYENRENSGSQELGITYKVLLAPFRKYA